jgi:carboxylesterase type B
LGYLYLGKVLGDQYSTSGNNGTLDQIAALKWIYNNAAAFGGDPSHITLIGESAGAKAIAALMVPQEERIRQKWNVVSDFMYRAHTSKLADVLSQRGLPVWIYSLEQAPAIHGMDMSLLWHMFCFAFIRSW